MLALATTRPFKDAPPRPLAPPPRSDASVALTCLRSLSVRGPGLFTIPPTIQGTPTRDPCRPTARIGRTRQFGKKQRYVYSLKSFYPQIEVLQRLFLRTIV